MLSQTLQREMHYCKCLPNYIMFTSFNRISRKDDSQVLAPIQIYRETLLLVHTHAFLAWNSPAVQPKDTRAKSVITPRAVIPNASPRANA